MISIIIGEIQEIEEKKTDVIKKGKRTITRKIKVKKYICNYKNFVKKEKEKNKWKKFDPKKGGVQKKTYTIENIKYLINKPSTDLYEMKVWTISIFENLYLDDFVKEDVFYSFYRELEGDRVLLDNNEQQEIYYPNTIDIYDLMDDNKTNDKDRLIYYNKSFLRKMLL